MLHTIFEICGITSICIGLPFIIVLVLACLPEITEMEGYGWKARADEAAGRERDGRGLPDTDAQQNESSSHLKTSVK